MVSRVRLWIASLRSQLRVRVKVMSWGFRLGRAMIRP